MRYLVVPGDDWMAERLIEAMSRHAGDHVLRVAEDAKGQLGRLLEFRPDAVVVRVPAGELSPLVVSILDLASFGRRPVIALSDGAELAPGEPRWAQAVCFAPFTPGRVRRVMQTLIPPAKRWEGDPVVLRCGDVELREDERAVLIAGERVALTYSEFEVLDALMRRPGVTVTRAELHVARPRSDGRHSRAVDVYIRRLRSKLGRASGFAIETVQGIGYRCGASMGIEHAPGEASERVPARGLSIPV